MRQSFSLRPMQSFIQTPRIALTHILQTQELLSIHPTALDLVLNSIELDPKGTEARLNELEGENDSTAKVKSMFSSLVRKDENKTPENREYNGTAISVPMNGLSSLIKEEVNLRPTPDVTYIGKENAKPETRYASHLIEAPRLSLSLLDEFPESKKLYKLLSKEREWISSTLREFYSNLGNFQREFIYSQDPVSLHIYQLKDAAKELGFHLTTVSRLRKGRYVSVIDSQNNKTAYPVTALMPNSDEYTKIALTDQLNYLLKRESEEKTSHSDDWLSIHSGLSRRAVTKYRSEAGIPNASQRGEAYISNPEIKYSIPINLAE